MERSIFTRAFKVLAEGFAATKIVSKAQKVAIELTKSLDSGT